MIHNLSSGASGNENEQIWLADNIVFTTPGAEHVMTPEPKFESEPPPNNPDANDQFPRMNDVDQASDDATIAKGLVWLIPNLS